MACLPLSFSFLFLPVFVLLLCLQRLAYQEKSQMITQLKSVQHELACSEQRAAVMAVEASQLHEQVGQGADQIEQVLGSESMAGRSCMRQSTDRVCS